MASTGGQVAVTNVRVFDGKAFSEPRTIVIQDELISDAPAGPDAQTIEGNGGYLIPGLIDSHVHINECCNIDFLTAAGVTTAISMACFPVHYLSRFKTYSNAHHLTDVRSTTVPATAVHSVHAMMLALEKHQLPTDPQKAEQWVQDRLFEHAEFIKVIADSPAGGDLKVFQSIVDAAHKHGKKVVAHAVTQRAVKNALEVGVDVLTHAPLDELIDEASVDTIVKRDTLVIPTLTMMNKMSHRKEYKYQHAEDSVSMLIKRGVRIHAGTDANAGPCAHEDTIGKVGFIGRLKDRLRDRLVGVAHGASLHDELGRLVKCGLTNLEALRAATEEPAKWWGWTDRGVIAPGLRADLVLLEADPLEDINNTQSIKRVWVAGHEYVKAQYAGAPAPGEL